MASCKCYFLQKTFLAACFFDDIKKVKACIEIGVDVHVKLEEDMISDEDFWDYEDMDPISQSLYIGCTGLDLAKKRDSPEIIDLLQSNNKWNEQMFFKACIEGNLEKVKESLELGVDINSTLYCDDDNVTFNGYSDIEDFDGNF